MRRGRVTDMKRVTKVKMFRKLNLPRAPIMKQTGGAHKVKTKMQLRDRKHKKDDWDQEC